MPDKNRRMGFFLRSPPSATFRLQLVIYVIISKESKQFLQSLNGTRKFLRERGFFTALSMLFVFLCFVEIAGAESAVGMDELNVHRGSGGYRTRTVWSAAGGIGFG